MACSSHVGAEHSFNAPARLGPRLWSNLNIARTVVTRLDVWFTIVARAGSLRLPSEVTCSAWAVYEPLRNLEYYRVSMLSHHKMTWTFGLEVSLLFRTCLNGRQSDSSVFHAHDQLWTTEVSTRPVIVRIMYTYQGQDNRLDFLPQQQPLIHW